MKIERKPEIAEAVAALEQAIFGFVSKIEPILGQLPENQFYGDIRYAHLNDLMRQCLNVYTKADRVHREFD